MPRLHMSGLTLNYTTIADWNMIEPLPEVNLETNHVGAPAGFAGSIIHNYPSNLLILHPNSGIPEGNKIAKCVSKIILKISNKY